MEEYWKTIYYNIILVRPTLKRYIKLKGIKANSGKRNLSYSIVNTIPCAVDKDVMVSKPTRLSRSRLALVK